MRQLNAGILSNKEVSHGYYRMRIESAYLAANASPGQFVEVLPGAGGTDIVLRRPLGVHRIVKGGIELLYEAAGKGTSMMSRMKPGECLDVIGPLGKGFFIERRASRTAGRQIIVAGGIGVAPLLALAESIARKGAGEIHVFIGGRTKSHILCAGEFKKSGSKVYITTEDGSAGRKCLVTDELAGFLLARGSARNAMIYACGPSGMLKAVSAIARDNAICCQVSLEERMACGVGVCLGCPVKVKKPGSPGKSLYEYKMVCKDGPVFDAEEIAW